jgi:rRNA maturation endonuclease Nob1
MKYLLDTHTLTNLPAIAAGRRDNLCVINEVAEEYAFVESEIVKLKSAGISIIHVSDRHLKKLKEVMALHGANTKLIRLWTGTGTADVVMLAFVLSERDEPQTLFPEEYTIVTRDNELTTVAKSYGINTMSRI